VDFSTTESVVPIEMSTTTISTAPAIVHMLMTPKSKDTNKPISPSEHLRQTMPLQDPHVFRLQEDLNSPSAFLRTRAIRALK